MNLFSHQKQFHSMYQWSNNCLCWPQHATETHVSPRCFQTLIQVISMCSGLEVDGKGRVWVYVGVWFPHMFTLKMFPSRDVVCLPVNKRERLTWTSARKIWPFWTRKSKVDHTCRKTGSQSRCKNQTGPNTAGTRDPTTILLLRHISGYCQRKSIRIQNCKLSFFSPRGFSVCVTRNPLKFHLVWKCTSCKV